MRQVFLSALLMITSTAAFAQFTNSSSSSSGNVSDGWNSLYVQYNPIALSREHGDAIWFNGFSVGYGRAFAVSSQQPFYVEAGVAAQFAFASESYYSEDMDYTLISVKIPVSFMYKWDVNENFSLVPNVGLDFRINAYGNLSYDDEDFNLFDDEADWNRFQVGWHIGANAMYKSFLFGASFGTDFNEIAKKCNMKTTSLTIGYKF